MVGWKVVKKGIEMRGFRKSFKIPNGVVLDKIKAKFNANESTLTISIPKLEKGEISGLELEEIEEDEVLNGDSQSSKVRTDEANERETSTQEDRESEAEEVKEMRTVEKLLEGNQSNESKEKIQEKEVCDSQEEKENHEVEKECDFDIGSPKSEPPQVIEKKESEKACLVEENRPINEANEREISTQENRESADMEVKEINQTVENLPEGNQCNKIEEEFEEKGKEVCDSKEEKENHEVQRETAKNGFKESDFDSGSTKSKPHQVTEQKESDGDSLVEENKPINEIPQVESENKEENNEIPEENKCDREDDRAETSRVSQPTDQEQQDGDRSMPEDESVGANIHEDDSTPRVEENSPRGRSKLCVPIVVGSALIVSFIVFVFHFIRAKNQSSRRRN